MKRLFYILLGASLLLSYPLQAQTPYDSFSPETWRPILDLGVFECEEETLVTEQKEPIAYDTILCAAVIDRQEQVLLLVDVESLSVLAFAPLNDDLRKWISPDPLLDKNITTSPYMYCNGNPIIYIDPNGLDTLHFDKDGLFTERIKADGEHVGIINNADGTKRQFKFLNQSDANRFWSNGSKEYDYLQEQNIAPFKGIYQISAEKMNQLTTSNISPWNHFSNSIAKILYAGIASQKDGKMDYNRIGEPILNMGASNGQQMLYLAEGSNYAQDSYNFGNMLWGQSMRQLGISPMIALAGAHLFTLLIDDRHEFDSLDDQFSILLGYFYCVTRHF